MVDFLMKNKNRKKNIMLILLIIIIVLVSSFGIYYVMEKEIRIEINPTNLVNNTIEVHINGKKRFDIFFNEESLLRRPVIRARYIKTTGIIINLKVIAKPLNESAQQEFNLLGGHSFRIGYNNGHFSFYQFRGNPQYE